MSKMEEYTLKMRQEFLGGEDGLEKKTHKINRHCNPLVPVLYQRVPRLVPAGDGVYGTMGTYINNCCPMSTMPTLAPVEYAIVRTTQCTKIPGRNWHCPTTCWGC